MESQLTNDTVTTFAQTLLDESDQWSPEIKFLISALDCRESPPMPFERRSLPRIKYRARLSVRLFNDPASDPQEVLVYTRDVNSQAIGFLSSCSLALGHDGIVTLMLPSHDVLDCRCRVLRCRRVFRHWHEGALSLLSEVPEFCG
jgi:hypothetical protein